MRKKCCYSQRNLGSICCSLYLVSNSPLTHNPFVTLSQPFRIKCEREIFLKKCVRSSLLLILFPHVYVYSCITAIQQLHTFNLRLKNSKYGLLSVYEEKKRKKHKSKLSDERIEAKTTKYYVIVKFIKSLLIHSLNS